jgi:hypothetical protein
MAHQADTAIVTTSYQFSLLQRGVLKLSEALAQWVQASAHKRQTRQDSATKGGARRRCLQDAERRREEALMQRLLLPRQF